MPRLNNNKLPAFALQQVNDGMDFGAVQLAPAVLLRSCASKTKQRGLIEGGQMDIKPLEVTWKRAFKLWWYITWRTVFATIGASVILTLLAAALMVSLKIRSLSLVGRIVAIIFRLLNLVAYMAFAITVTKQAFKKQFSDFKIVMIERESK